MEIVIKANNNAKSRTKNRIREHGGTFETAIFGTPKCLDGRKAVLLTAPDGQWQGWLPMDEIEVLFFCGLEVIKTENVTVTDEDADNAAQFGDHPLATGGTE